jgi:hypothetical protein
LCRLLTPWQVLGGMYALAAMNIRPPRLFVSLRGLGPKMMIGSSEVNLWCL